ncbi:hypothetical protein H8E52_12890 [bacterium]|nr:hypothetical protein [bacterium]
MASTAAPYGFVPVNRIGGYENGSFRQFKLTNSYGTSIFFGDIAELDDNGLIIADQNATSTRPIGVFQGCSYTDPTLKYKLFNQMWLASVSAMDILAHVADDPNQLFQVQSDATMAQTTLGNNVEIITYAAGNTSIGKSILAVDGANAATTNTFPFRVIDFVDGPDSAVGDAYTDVIVRWAFGIHQYELALGT